MPGRRSTGKLAVSVSPTFAIRWLLPRLQRFNKRHPDIEVSVDTTHRLVEFPRDGIDLAIRLGSGNWPELYATCLVRQTLVPVCAPSLAATLQSRPTLRVPPSFTSSTSARTGKSGVNSPTYRRLLLLEDYASTQFAWRRGGSRRAGRRHWAPALDRRRHRRRPRGGGTRPTA